MAEDINKDLVALLPNYERVTRIVSSLLENILREQNIEYLNITHRTKNRDSILEKIRRKSYSDFRRQMTDISGVRVITYLNSHVRVISEIIEKLFNVDPKNSLDRSQILGDDRVGYRSVHFVCNLGETRSSIMEYHNICEIPFEIQVRTVLQHAWAELTHDRSYKFTGALPSHLQRELNLYSGMLEIVDNAFDKIATSVDSYTEQLSGEELPALLEEGLNSISVPEFLQKFCREKGVEMDDVSTPGDIVDVMLRFGIKNIANLENFLSDDFIKFVKKYDNNTPAYGFLNGAMLWQDAPKLLSLKRDWSVLAPEHVRLLEFRYGKEKADQIIKDYVA